MVPKKQPKEPLAKLGVSGITKEADLKTPSVLDDLFFNTLLNDEFCKWLFRLLGFATHKLKLGL